MDNKLASNKEIVLRQWFAAKYGNKFENYRDWALPKNIAAFEREYTLDNPLMRLSFNFIMGKLRDIEHEVRLEGTFNVHADQMVTQWLDGSVHAKPEDVVSDSEAPGEKPRIVFQAPVIEAPKEVVLNVECLEDMEFPIFRNYPSGTLFDEVASEIKELPGLLSGSVIICCGESGVGKSTLLIDLLAKIRELDTTVEPLYISTEMTKTDLYFYMQKQKKIGKVKTLLMHQYLKYGLKEAIEKAFLESQYPIILLDSFQDLVEKMADLLNWRAKEAENFVIGLMLESAEKLGKCVIAIQHLTKGGEYVGRTFLKHTTTAMLELRFDKQGRRYACFAKNRRNGGMQGVPMYFDLDADGNVTFDREHFDQAQEAKAMIGKISEKQKLINDNFGSLFHGMKTGDEVESELEEQEFQIVNEADDE